MTTFPRQFKLLWLSIKNFFTFLNIYDNQIIKKFLPILNSAKIITTEVDMAYSLLTALMVMPFCCL